MTFWCRLAVRESLERPRLPARASRRASRPLSGRGTITEEQDTRLVHPVDETPRRTAVDELPPDRRAMSPSVSPAARRHHVRVSHSLRQLARFRTHERVTRNRSPEEIARRRCARARGCRSMSSGASSGERDLTTACMNRCFRSSISLRPGLEPGACGRGRSFSGRTLTAGSHRRCLQGLPPRGRGPRRGWRRVRVSSSSPCRTAMAAVARR